MTNSTATTADLPLLEFNSGFAFRSQTMRLAFRLLCVLGLTTLAASSTQAAPFEGFEVPSGLGNFSTPGTGSIALVETGASNGISAPEGAKYAVIESPDTGAGTGDRGEGVSSTTSELETFLGLSSGDIGLTQSGGGNTNDAPANGSAIQATVAVTAGDVISFEYLFLTNEYVSSSNPDANAGNDFAFVVLDGVSYLLDGVREGFFGDHQDFVAAPSSSGYIHMANGGAFQTFTALPPATSTGSVLLSFAVMNVIDNTRSSGLFIDNITITPASTGGGSVPEPSALALLMIGSTGLLVRRRRFHGVVSDT